MTLRHKVCAILATVAVAAALSGCGTGAAGPGHGGTTGSGYVVGVVYAAPACPVESDTGGCPRRPISGASVEIRLDGTRVASGQTDPRGRFRLESPPGDGVIEVQQSTGGLGSNTQRDIHVTSGQTTRVRLGLDIGIRMPASAP